MQTFSFTPPLACATIIVCSMAIFRFLSGV
jgi:hypothetical protein